MSNFKIYEDSQNYTCTIVEMPEMFPVPGLDNLMRVEVFGNSCLVGKDSSKDTLYCFFPAGTEIAPKFLSSNNLYRENQLNENPDKKGFFEKNYVKAIKFKGVISTGFLIPVEALEGIVGHLGLAFHEGDEFNEIDGIMICKKYIPKIINTPGEPKSKQDRANEKQKNIIVPNQFAFHVETSHLSKNIWNLSPDSDIIITDKWHGSSVILSNCLVYRKLSLWEKIKKFFGMEVKETQYGFVYSSGKPKSNRVKGVMVDGDDTFVNTAGDYYSANIWKKAMLDYGNALMPGIAIYGEVVGFAGNSPIQGQWTYGCKPGEYKMVVYRITYTNEEGIKQEFSWNQVKSYCEEKGLTYVPEFYQGKAKDLFPELDVSQHWHDNFFNKLSTSFNMEQKCKICNNGAPAEGLVVRVERPNTEEFEVYKLKAKLFTLKENELIDSAQDLEIEQ